MKIDDITVEEWILHFQDQIPSPKVKDWMLDVFAGEPVASRTVWRILNAAFHLGPIARECSNTKDEVEQLENELKKALEEAYDMAYTDDDIDDARNEGYDRGHYDGLQEGKDKAQKSYDQIQAIINSAYHK